MSNYNSKKKNWFFLFSSNYIGVLNDNFLKHCIIFIGVTWILPVYITQSTLISLVSAALVVPYLLFSPLGGRLAVIYSKQKVFLYCKLAEIPLMLIATISFYYKAVWLSVIAVFLMGVQSCLYSPSKYGLIRDIGGEKGISFGNGVFETMAFLGILSGTFFASLLADSYSFSLVAVLFIGLALAGYITSSQINVKEPEFEKTDDTSINPIKFIKKSYLFAKKFPFINTGIVGVSIFWLVGGLLQMNLVIHCTKTLLTSNTVAGITMAIAAVGIAAGCTVSGKLSRGTVNTHLIFIGLAGMIIFLAGIVIFNPPIVICSILVFFIAFMGGMFEVPCLALIQKADTGRKLGDILAYMNIVIFMFILAGSGLFFITTRFVSDNSLVVFALIALICLITLIYFWNKKLVK